MQYIHELPSIASFDSKGLIGYSFGQLMQKDLEVLYVESEKGHDTFVISKKVIRTYYILGGNGYFTINKQQYDVSAGTLIEIPAKVEFSYSGKMTLLAFCKPRWFVGNDKFTRWNSDVVGQDSPYALDGGPWWKRLIGLRIFGKSPTNAYLRLSQKVWNNLPSSFTTLSPVRLYGNFLHRLARIQMLRAQAFSTFFLRNRPQLELIRRILEENEKFETLRVAVLGCSAGPEAYSVAWAIRSRRPGLKLVLYAMDISREAIEFARRGKFPLNVKRPQTTIHDRMGAGHWRLDEPGAPLAGEEVFERMTSMEMEEFFDRAGDTLRVKSWIKEGIEWQVGDARDPGMFDVLGLQDIVVANNFLCHMSDSEAEESLRNIARLVAPGGYIFVSGIDLDVRTKIARELGWKPVQDLLAEVHDGDPILRREWPCQYSGLEPFDKKRQDWMTRYAAAFQISTTQERGVRETMEQKTGLIACGESHDAKA